jgi:hypothetical protein
MDEERKRKHEAAQAAKVAASVNVRARSYIPPTTVEVISSTPVDWKHWGKLKSVMVFEALALLSNTEPSEEPQEPEDASPEYRKRHRLLLDSLADGNQFTAGTLNMGNASLNGVSLIEVARWALANGITLPDNFPRPVRVSQAPPPISPVRGSSYIPPKKSQPIDWAHWQLMPIVKLQEAVALSVNVNPDYVTKVDDVLIKRMKIALSHVDAGSLPLEQHYANLPMSPVSLAKFAAWALKLNITDLPPELVAMAATATTAPVVMPAQNTATPAPVVAGGKKWTDEKLTELKTYREAHTMPETAVKFGISEQRIRELLPSEKAKAKPFAGLTHRMK